MHQKKSYHLLIKYKQNKNSQTFKNYLIKTVVENLRLNCKKKKTILLYAFKRLSSCFFVQN